MSDYWLNLGTRNYSSGLWSLQEVSLYLIRNLNLFDQELNCKFCFVLGGPCDLFFLGAKKEFWKFWDHLSITTLRPLLKRSYFS